MPVIVIGTPHRRTDFHPEYIVSLADTLIHSPNDFEFRYVFRQGGQIHALRNAIAAFALTRGDYLLFVDTDTHWTPKDIENLVALDKDIASGLCFSKMLPPTPQVFRIDPAKGMELISTIPEEPFQCDGTSAGFLLIKCKVIETFRTHGVFPFDLIPIDDVTGEKGKEWWTRYLSEDLSFCVMARRFGFEIWCDPTVLPGHIGVLDYGKAVYEASR